MIWPKRGFERTPEPLLDPDWTMLLNQTRQSTLADRSVNILLEEAQNTDATR